MPILTPEQQAQEQIDQMLEASGWQVQTRKRMNLASATGVAVCEFPMKTGAADYLLYAHGRPIGVVEAKKAGTPLSGVEVQAKKYTGGLPAILESKAWYNPLPFRYESTGVETFFADEPVSTLLARIQGAKGNDQSQQKRHKSEPQQMELFK